MLCELLREFLRLLQDVLGPRQSLDGFELLPYGFVYLNAVLGKMPLDRFRQILDLLVVVFLHQLAEALQELHIVVEEGLRAEHLLQEVGVHRLFVGVLPTVTNHNT